MSTPAELPTDATDALLPTQRNSWQTLQRLAPFLRPYRARITVAAMALLVAAAATLAIPAAFRVLIDRGFGDLLGTAGTATEAQHVNGVFILLFLIALLLAVATAIRYYCVTWLGDRITADLRQTVFDRVLRQDPVFFETLRTGEVLSRLSSDTTLIQSL